MKTQYKLWIHIEKWVDGNPVEVGPIEESPEMVIIGDDNLFDDLESALAMQTKLCNINK